MGRRQLSWLTQADLYNGHKMVVCVKVLKMTYRHIICHEEQESILPDGLEFKEDIVLVCCITDLAMAGITSSIKLINARLKGFGYWPANKILLLRIYWCLQCFDAVGWAAGRASGL